MSARSVHSPQAQPDWISDQQSRPFRPTSFGLYNLLRDRGANKDPCDLFSVSASTADKVINDKNNHRADDGNEHAVEVQSADTFSAKERKNPTADDSPDDAEHDIQHHSLAFLVNDAASDKARNQAENDPTYDGHDFLLNFKTELIEERPNAIFVQEINALTSILPDNQAGAWTVSRIVSRLAKMLLLNRNIELSVGALRAFKAFTRPRLTS
jgi:hypothetical protein